MATRAYQHSRVFDEYKQTQEGIKENLTSLQYLQTLDYFIWHALAPIVTECPILFNNYLAKIAARQALKTSTKFTSEERHKLPIKLFNTLTATTPKQMHERAKDMRINRGLLFGFVAFFCASLRRYEKLNNPMYEIGHTERVSEIAAIETAMGLRTNGSLYSALQQVKYWDEKARKFKALIVEKYTRMALMQSKNTYEDFNHAVPLDDIVQEYMMTVSRAIDRCDSNQGVLTTFITSWFKSAKSEVARMAKGQHDQSYESLTDDVGDSAAQTLGFVMPDTSHELQQHVSAVAKRVDPVGYLRASLHIPEFLTSQQRASLLLFVEDV